MLLLQKQQDPWKYFSFAKGDFVDLTEEEAATSLEWDIAFQRYYIRTNSGTSGKGQGGALDMAKDSFDDVPNVPTSGYTEDELISMMTTMGSFEDKSGRSCI